MQKEKRGWLRNYRVPFKVYSKYTIETEVVNRTGSKQKEGGGEYKSDGGGERTLNIIKNENKKIT